MKKLLVINTIGLTGVEVLASEIAKFPEVLFLPGQNFIQFNSCLYRYHDYNDFTHEEIFMSLNRHQYTKDGRCWSGLTKHMSLQIKQKYNLSLHKKMFVDSLGKDKDTLNCIIHYCQTFFDCMDINTEGFSYFGFWGANFVLSDSDKPDFLDKVKVINWNADVYSWLSMISSRMTWDCIEACKFWIVNNLFLSNYGNQNSAFINIERESFLLQKEKEIKSIKKFIHSSDKDNTHFNNSDSFRFVEDLGFVKFNQELVNSIEENAADLRKIYSKNIYFQMADSIDTWSRKFIDNSANQSLLLDYQKFWNSTAHTNFDWIDPISLQVIESALRMSGYEENVHNLSCDFYHKYSNLSSDTHDQPRVAIEHSWGSLEDEIVIPKTPYHIKVVLQYLENIASNHIKYSHSCLSIKNGNLYKRIMKPEYQQKIQQFGLMNKMEKVNDCVRQVEEIVKILLQTVNTR
jgi:hypothetical protein